MTVNSSSKKVESNWIYQPYYISLFCPEHPFSDCNGLVCEHRIVMEKWLRKKYPDHPALIEVKGELYLRPRTTVQHINGKKYDNRIENLLLAFLGVAYTPKNQICIAGGNIQREEFKRRESGNMKPKVAIT